MSAVDQAFIRAYSPESPAAATTVATPKRTKPTWQPQVVSPDEPAAPPEPPSPQPQPAAQPQPVPQPQPAPQPAPQPQPAPRPAPQPQLAPQPQAAPVAQPPSMEPPAPAAQAGALQPVYQVEALAWPSDCTKLGLQASGALERLTDALLGPPGQPARVAAVAGCRQGDGCTTLLACAARRLAQGDRRVIVVDADFANPQIARRLGVLPEYGWEDVLAGQLPLAEAVIESVQDRLAMLPLKGPVREAGRVVESRVATSLRLLAEHYDLVLVDLGDLSHGLAAAALGEAVDRAVVVRDLRFSGQADLGRARGRLQAAGIPDVGVVENFV